MDEQDALNLGAVCVSRMEKSYYTKTRTIAERTIGTRTIVGTDWPVVDKVERQVYDGRIEWVVVRGLCNGVPRGSRAFKTRSEALLEFGA